MSTRSCTLGVDVGATLCKVAMRREGFELAQFSSHELDKVCAHVERCEPARIVATGGGAQRLPQGLAGVDLEVVPEFEALARGAARLAAEDGLELEQPYLVASIGTGTSVLMVSDAAGTPQRVGGTALGGGALLGMGQLLLGESSFEQICALAAQGDRRKVDLLVSDIYPKDAPLPPDLNAASFGKLGSRDPADLAHAIVGMLGENVGLICAHLLQLHDARALLYCGSTLAGNPALCAILRGVIGMYRRASHVLSQGPYCGAIGAALVADERTGHRS
jgi:type II pantothenate kinase